MTAEAKVRTPWPADGGAALWVSAQRGCTGRSEGRVQALRSMPGGYGHVRPVGVEGVDRVQGPDRFELGDEVLLVAAVPGFGDDPVGRESGVVGDVEEVAVCSNSQPWAVTPRSPGDDPVVVVTVAGAGR